MEILHAYGVPDETINAINILYTNTMAQVLTPDGISIAITDTDFADDSIVKYFKTDFCKKLKRQQDKLDCISTGAKLNS